MRVYEFAKERGLSSKDVIALLSKNGFEVSSHMSVLSDDAMQFLTKESREIADDSGVSAHVDAKVLEVETKKESFESKQMPVVADKEKKVISAPMMQQPSKSVQSTPKAAGSKKEFEEIIAPQVDSSQLVLIPYTLSDLAIKLNKTTSDLILTLLKWGILSNKNQLLTEDVVAKIAQNYEIKTIRPATEKPQEHKVTARASASGPLTERTPVVVIMGHVDHGKTTLLDFIRKTRVAAREKGGITQHLGAYEAKTPQGGLVFIDTPGHEAFSKIRVRGTKVADIVVLVVAADDGIMPQTVEALRHAQSMNVPIVVAINKIDKVDKSRIDIVKRDLATQYELLPEEWGGQTIYVPISGKTGLGVDKLLEMIVLQSQLMELQAQAAGNAFGFVLESKLEKGRGAVATVLTQQGLLKVGDYFVAGKTAGKISSMVDSYGQRTVQVGPSHPVQVAGFNDLPEAGDTFEVVDKETYLRTKQLQGSQRQPAAQRSYQSENDIPLIIKTDTNSSKEALLESISKLSKKNERGFLILQSGIGNVSESDVMLAHDAGARVVTLHVKTEPNAVLLAQRSGVSITSFDIIYKLLEHLQELADKMAPVKMVRVKTGEAFVRKVFDIKNLGIIAGSYVKQGVFSRDGVVAIWRGNKKIGEGNITSLQRDKNTVKEVHAGYECAFMVEDFKDWQIDDRVECFVERPESAPKK